MMNAPFATAAGLAALLGVLGHSTHARACVPAAEVAGDPERCGDFVEVDGEICYCDDVCQDAGDCCEDYTDVCEPGATGVSLPRN